MHTAEWKLALSTVRNLKSVLGSIRALFSALYFLSLRLRLYLEILGWGFFADDLVIIATSLEECVERVKAWKEGLESKGLHVNMTKTKIMASGLGLDILQDSGKFPCAVCRTGVGRSSIRCSKCNLWVHYKKCSGLKTLAEDMSYECPRCRGEPGVRPINGHPFKEVEVGDCVLEAVDRFCYLGDMLSAGGGCMAAATARCRCAWRKFRENLPLLTSKPVPFDLRGRLFSSNVGSSMLHGTETWPMTSDALHRLCRNDPLDLWGQAVGWPINGRSACQWTIYATLPF